METKNEPRAQSQPRPELAAPVFPSTPSEFITLLAHYHRAEIARMAGWRDRIDHTTNWAITVAGAMLSVSLSTPSAHHGVVIFAMVLVLLLLVIESRRYRFFDVYRNRVRRLERNYFAQVLSPEIEPEKGWTQALGEDLRRPRFGISLSQAMSRRLRRNYCWLFLILLLAWLLKITSAKLQPGAGQDELGFSLPAWFDNAAIGPLPGWLVVPAVAIFYGWVTYITFRHYKEEGELAYGDVHV
ncbi:Uncharacterized membrane protein [Rhizobiales bacterium GAS191]|nr:Uncharacterized membrane protein [Rhizobiales bacterium GAS113]SEE90497.1 Uncharacterized membrane protein [Rhizobiales bacterium GAS191]